MDDTRENPRPRDVKALFDAERTGVPFIYWYDGEHELHVEMLSPDRARVTIGRKESCDVALTWDPEVSRAHAFLEPAGEDWTVVDDGLSRNGSFVSGSRIHGRQRLNDRETVTFGRTRVTYRGAASGRGSVSTARAPGSPDAALITETQRKVLIALCSPIVEGKATSPATNPTIADEVHLSTDAVKAHLRGLFDRFGLSDLPQNEKRSRLVSVVLDSGLLQPHDF